MTILTMRTDKPEAEIGLYQDSQQVAYEVWEAHRQLAETLHMRIKVLLEDRKMSLNDIEGIVVFKGPGSFTGLRIGLSVANALAYGLGVPIVATQSDWIEKGITKLLAGDTDSVSLPEYGAPVHITQQKK